MTFADLYESFQTSIAMLRDLRQRAGLEELDLEDGPELRADARRFADQLEIAPDLASAEYLTLADRAGAQAFWYLVRTRWETMETFLLPSAFELLPEPKPFEALCRCEWWLDETVPPAPLPEDPALCPPEQPGQETAELGWSDASPTAEMPGVVRPVRATFAIPEAPAGVVMDMHSAEPKAPERGHTTLSHGTDSNGQIAELDQLVRTDAGT